MIADTVEKQWYTLGQVSSMTGLKVNKLRILADKNRRYLRISRGGTRKLHKDFVHSLVEFNI
jgi:hypothetical protein